MSLLELKGLILPWLDLSTLVNLQATCRSIRDPIRRHFLQTYDESAIFVQSTDEREANALRTGQLAMDSWICECGQKNTLTYQTNDQSDVILSGLTKNFCLACGKNLMMKRLFLGQLKRKNTLPSILFLLRMLCSDIQIITIENRIDQTTHRDKGCCWVTVIDWTAHMLLSFHRRIFFDTILRDNKELSGFWIVPYHHSWITYLDQLANKKRGTKCRSLPRKPMVVEIANMQMKNSRHSPENSQDFQRPYLSLEKSFNNLWSEHPMSNFCSNNHVSDKTDLAEWSTKEAGLVSYPKYSMGTVLRK